MKNNVLFRGIMPALFTPLNEDSTVNAPVVAPLIKWQLERGVDGFYVLGATGEGAVLAEKERMIMAEAAADVLRGTGKKLILHVGAADTREAERLARHAGRIGADAVSSVYPNFFRVYSMEEAKDYYRALIDAAGVPMLCYCQPMLKGGAMEFAEEIMKVEGVIGLKYTFPNYYDLFMIKQLNGGNINVINGPDESLICGLSMGADGGIGTTYNMMPDRYVRLYQAFLDGDWETARRMQASVNRVIAVMLAHGFSAFKLGMEALGFDVGPAAFPAKRFTPEEKKALIEAFREAGLFEGGE